MQNVLFIENTNYITINIPNMNRKLWRTFPIANKGYIKGTTVRIWFVTNKNLNCNYKTLRSSTCTNCRHWESCCDVKSTWHCDMLVWDEECSLWVGDVCFETTVSC